MRHMSLSAKILLGMGLGIFTGLFFGEKVTFLNIVGDGFVQLLQITILPFVTFSLILGLGGLTYKDALLLGKKCGILLLVLWAVVITFVAIMPLAFPNWVSASFFSPTLVEQRAEVDFLKLYIPANPFFSLSNSIVPAIVVFSLAMGIALIGIEAKRKKGLLEMLSVLVDTLTRVTGFVVQLAPIGVFAIAAGAAGTMNLEELGRLQVYMFSYVVLSAVLTFYVLPALVTTLTPLTYNEVVLPVRSALITGFATGNLMVILPILTERGRELLRDAELTSAKSASVVEVIVPASFTFPTIGSLLSLSFIPFAGWYVGSELSFAQYPGFLVSGLVSFFGGAMVAMPFLLDLLRLPADMFKLFVTVDVFTGRFGTLLAAMHVWVLALLGTSAMSGKLTLHWGRLSRYVVVSLLVTIVAVGTVRAFFTYGVEHLYTKYTTFVEMDMLDELVPVKVHEKPPPPEFVDLHTSRLDRIRERGTLRVGYFKDALPFIFRNAKNKLVGLDVEMVNGLAKSLGVSLELVLLPVSDRKGGLDQLDSEVCDIIVPGFAISPERTENFAFALSHMDLTMAFLVKDYRRDEFTTWEAVRSLEAPRLGITTASRYYNSIAQALVPEATLVPIDSPRDFLRGKAKDLDALIYAAEPGSAWTLVYPQFTVAVPFPDPMVVPMAYPLPHNAKKFVTFVNTWIMLKKKDGTLDKIFDHWILGKAAESKEPRWSIIRNVLGWVD